MRDADITPSGLDPDLAARLAKIALGHVRREFPYKPDHVLTDGGRLPTPRDLHPIFFGSFDWHSCVHSYWMLARLLRLHPALSVAAEVAALFDAMLVDANVSAERRYLDDPATRSFERPYGWAWILKLAAELARHSDRGWSATLAPLSGAFACRFTDYLPVATYPVRTGSHHNSAFALRLAADYAEAFGDAALSTLLTDTAHRWFASDADCPAWGEPGGEDFLSPALIEAECMRRHMAPDRFLAWFGRFLPSLARRRPANLFAAATVSDRSDGRIAHLDGLNLSRAWCFRAISAALSPDDPRRPIMIRSAEHHLAAALPYLATDYMGEHWLATFAVLALTE